MQPQVNVNGSKPEQEKPQRLGPELPGTPETRLAAEIIAWLYRDVLKELRD